jgi:hypothetical protein
MVNVVDSGEKWRYKKEEVPKVRHVQHVFAQRK